MDVEDQDRRDYLQLHETERAEESKRADAIDELELEIGRTSTTSIPVMNVAESAEIENYAWACSKEVKAIALEGTSNSLAYALGDVTGPLCPILRFATCITLLTQILTLVCTRYFADCKGSHDVKDVSFATYPVWTWLLLLPAAATKMYAELQLAKHVCFPFNLRASFKMFGLKAPFLLWFLFYGVLSQANLADVGSDSMFTATTLESISCSGGRLEKMWEQVWQQSLLGQVHVPPVRLYFMLSGFWAFSLVQMIWPLLRTLRQDEISFKALVMCQSDLYNLGNDGPCKAVLPCVGDDNGTLSPDMICFSLADASGLATMSSLSIVIAKVDAEECIKQEWYYSAHLTFYNLCNDLQDRVFLSWIGENCVQLNMQSTIFALQMAMMRKFDIESSGLKWQALASLTLSALMSIFKLVEARDFYHVLKLANDEEFEGYSLHGAIQRKKIIIACGCMLLLCSIGYAACKIIAIHFCESALWNLSGCVQLD